MASVDTDLEELMSHLGEFGKYQAWQFVLHIIAGLTAGLHMMTLTTVAAVPDHKCLLPQFDMNLTGIQQNYSSLNVNDNSWNESFLLHTIPRTLDDNSCIYLDAKNETQTCEAWTYNTTYYKSSRGMEWNFVCSRKWMGAVAQSTYMFGVFAGAVILGSMADKYGRKIIFYVSSVAQLILGVLVAFVPEYYTFLVIRFLYGVFGSAGAYITGFVLTMELVGPSKRTICGIMFQVCFASGFMLVAVWGSIIKDRMWLQIIYGLHSVLLVGHWWLMDESPRWLWAQGRVKEAVAIVQKGLKMNGCNDQRDIASLVSKSKAERLSQEDTSFSGMDLFKTPNLRKKTLNVCLNWFANSIAYYGLSLNAKNLDGNPYLMLFFSGLVEIPSYAFTTCLMDRTGRRSLLSTFMLVGGLCCISATQIPEDEKGAITVISLLGKSCIAGSFAIIYNYTAELFPTVVRNTALGIGSMCARLSGALTPLIMLLDSFNPKVPPIVFGFIAIVSGFLALYLPETVNQPMPETLEDGENFGLGDTCFASCSGRKRKAAYGIAMHKVNDIDKDESRVPKSADA